MKRGATIPEALLERLRFLPDDMDFLLRPCHAGMCRFESLKDGSLKLDDIWLMNQYLDNESHNRAEIRSYYDGKRT